MTGKFRIHERVVSGPLARHCVRLIAAEVAPDPGVQLTVVPHGSFVFSITLAPGPDPLAARRSPGWLPHLCGLRRERHTYLPPGEGRTLFAELTPEAGFLLSGGTPVPLDHAPRFPLAALVSARETAALEERLARCADPASQLDALGSWLEGKFAAPPRLPVGARRAAGLAARIFRDPGVRIADLPLDYAGSRRQMERDVARWLQASPTHLSLVARVQSALHLALRGHRLADVAHEAGFADQPHMNRVVRALTGHPPGALLRHASQQPNTLFNMYARMGMVYIGHPA